MQNENFQIKQEFQFVTDKEYLVLILFVINYSTQHKKMYLGVKRVNFTCNIILKSYFCISTEDCLILFLKTCLIKSAVQECKN